MTTAPKKRASYEFKACERCESTFRVPKGDPIPAHKARFRPSFDLVPCVARDTKESP